MGENYKSMLIALAGVSTDKTKIGYKMFEDLLASNFNVRGINPKNGEILGQKIYRNLFELEQTPDIVVIVVKPEIAEKVVDDAGKKGVKKIWFQPGAESDAAIKRALDYGMWVSYGKCFMSENGIW
ncbi:MAG: CoA-binding protein [Candidatus Omnitrophica bacterium]|nr:CoA-binding protein [Candidatus Omnitrophota bacterium]MCM8822906.1 CoA-binding protein [Candidatus Omnitrophota bacterium]MCM8825624.1 CoA-binding protein [Candidatus Omnitrophota bacterium]MCM8828603.1 CoA-binding protein [Candidatus Omnitrophota bacterium]